MDLKKLENQINIIKNKLRAEKYFRSSDIYNQIRNFMINTMEKKHSDKKQE